MALEEGENHTHVGKHNTIGNTIDCLTKTMKGGGGTLTGSKAYVKRENQSSLAESNIRKLQLEVTCTKTLWRGDRAKLSEGETT